MSLEDQFTARLKDAVTKCRELGYQPNMFAQMLESQGGVSTAKKLVSNGDAQHGFRQVMNLNRADLTMESIMLDSQFSSLFTKNELAAAKWRLDNANRI